MTNIVLHLNNLMVLHFDVLFKFIKILSDLIQIIA